MATTIVTKNGSGAPAAGDLVQGELAVDLTNQTLYSKDSSGNVFKVGDTGGGSPGTFTDLVATDSFTSPGIDDNATSTAITIDANENVGIGVTGANLNEPLVVQGSIKLRGSNALWFGNTSGYLGLESTSSTNLVLKNNAANGELGFETNGSERMRIDASGNVGIGTDTPARNLTIGGSTAATTHLQLTNATSGTTTGDGFQISQYTSGAVQLWNKENSYVAFGTNNTERMRIDSDGNLSLNGKDNRHLNVTSFDTNSVGAGWDFNASSSNGEITLSTAGAERLSVDNLGHVTLAEGGKLYLKSSTAPSPYMQEDNQAWTVNTGSAERMRISATGATTVTGNFNAQGAGSGLYATAIGVNAGNSGQQTYATAVGPNAGYSNQSASAVAVGRDAGKTSQGTDSVAVGRLAASLSQGNQAVSVGMYAGYNTQGSFAVAVGRESGGANQGDSTVAIGNSAGNSSQSVDAVAIGKAAGETSQGASSVAVGRDAGTDTQGDYAIALGRDAGKTDQSSYAAAIGYQAGIASQGVRAVAVGFEAGRNTQAESAVSVGDKAGKTDQGVSAVAVGLEAGLDTQGINAVAYGRQAGRTNQGASSVAIGARAGQTNQGANGIIISSGGVAINRTVANHIMLYSGSGKYMEYNGTDSWTFNGGDVVVPNDSLAVGGTSALSHKLYVEDSNDRTATTAQMCIFGNGYAAYHFLDATAYNIAQNSSLRAIRMWSATPGTGVQLSNASTSWSTFSDENLKENISDIGPVLDTIKDFQCVNYSLKATESEAADKVGFIAQDWEHTFPNVVDKDEEGTLSMKYTETIPVLLKAIQEQQAMIETLQAEVAALKGA